LVYVTGAVKKDAEGGKEDEAGAVDGFEDVKLIGW
jgi:hypothetical protein